MIALVAAMLLTPNQVYDRAKALAEALPPPGPYVCEAEETAVYCCRKPARLTHLVGGDVRACVEKDRWGFEIISPPIVTARFDGDAS